MSEKLSKQAEVVIPDASRHLRRLCKHFAHKVTAVWNDERGEVDFAEGKCLLHTTDQGLHFLCEAENQGDLHEIVDTIDRHFARFTRDTGLSLQWQ